MRAFPLSLYVRFCMWACGGAGAWLRGRATHVPIGENARNQLSEAYTTGQKTNYDNSSQCVVWWRSEGQRQAVELNSSVLVLYCRARRSVRALNMFIHFFLASKPE